MSLDMLVSFFMWCSIINLGLLLWAFLICSLAGGWVYRIHSRFYHLSRTQFDMAIYCFLGAYKLFVFAFFVVPWIALLIVR